LEGHFGSAGNVAGVVRGAIAVKDIAVKDIERKRCSG
jgi:hypothetical protein